MQGNWQTDLDKWEKDLRELLPGVTLLGELDLAGTDRDQIAAALSSGIAAEGAARFTREVGCRWPVALSAYLVAEGVLSYREGALWPQVCERLGLPKANYPARWGQIFLKTVRRLGKPDFRDLITQEHASRYLTVILAHGGIPNSCLPDLFRHVPGRSGRRRAMPRAAELIERWRNDPKALRLADRPVRRFLCHGGKIAEDFLDRYLGLVGYAREHGTLPDHSQFGLPARVVDAYRQWPETRNAHRRVRQRSSIMQARPSTRRQPPRASPAERRERAAVRRRASWRIAAPFLALDPYNAGTVVMCLPRQRLNHDQVTGQFTWIVQDDNREERVTLPVWKSGKLLLTDERTLEIQSIAPQYHVTLLSEHQIIREWDVQGIPEEFPFLAFFDDAQKKKRESTAIPAGWTWLLLHKSITIDLPVNPEIEIPLKDNWSEFTAYYLNLEGQQFLSLKRDGATLDPIPLYDPHDLARFISTPILATEGADGETPIFSEPPTIGIPVDPGQKVDAQLARCSLSVRSVIPDSKSHLGEPVRAGDLTYTLQEGEAVAQVSLASLLPSPLGMFELQVRRALGQDQRLRFAVIPGLRVEGHDRLILPSPGGHPRKAAVRVYCPTSGRLVAEHNGLRVQREQISDNQDKQLVIWRVDVDAALDTIPLRYEDRFHTGNKVIIPLTIPVPRLSWSITGLATDTTSNDAGTPHVFQDSFTAAADPTLAVTAPDGSDLASLRVTLWHPGGTQEIPAERRRQRSPAGRWSFRLGICQDTVRAVQEQTELTVTLEVRYKGEATADQLEVLRITCPSRPVSVPRGAPSSLEASPPLSTDPHASPPSEQPQVSPLPSSSSLTAPTPPVAAPPPPLSALPTAPTTRSPRPRPAPTQERLTERHPQPVYSFSYSFSRGTVKDSSGRDQHLGKAFREAPDPKSLQFDSDGHLIIEVCGQRYAPACNICNDNLTDTAIRSSVESESVYFKKCKHRIPCSEVILGRLLP
ncbi:MAG: hypothetical protein C4346_09530 [Chloroflexota bacterium]